MRHSRSQFKHTLRVCKNRKNPINADKIPTNLCKKDDRAFCGEIQKNCTCNSKIILPSVVGMPTVMMLLILCGKKTIATSLIR